MSLMRVANFANFAGQLETAVGVLENKCGIRKVNGQSFASEKMQAEHLSDKHAFVLAVSGNGK